VSPHRPGTAAGSSPRIAAEPFDSAEAAALLDGHAAELVGRYGYDAEPGAKPTAADISVFLVARDADGRALGCGALRHLEPGAAELKRMYVRPEARGQGLGRMLLEALEAEARRLGVGVLRLETGYEQHEAMALYEDAGYQRIPCWGAYAEGPVSLCYERRL
jgi:putative acetyltransferase